MNESTTVAVSHLLESLSPVKRSSSNSKRQDSKIVKKRKKTGFLAFECTYTPYDRQSLLDRISTFDILFWNIEENNVLTPLECAINGFQCQRPQRNVLECVTCKSVIKVNDPSEDDSTLWKSYTQRLSSDHYKGCPWREVKVPLYYYNFSLNDSDTLRSNLKRNIKSLCENRNIVLSKKFCSVLSHSDLETLSKRFPLCDDTLLNIAVLGWELHQQQFGHISLCILKCKMCCRRILLGEKKDSLKLPPSNYLTPCKFQPSTFPEDCGEEGIDLVAEHRGWCAYVNPCAEINVPGYRVILDPITANHGVNEATKKSSSAKESLKRLREMKLVFEPL